MLDEAMELENMSKEELIDFASDIMDQCLNAEDELENILMHLAQLTCDVEYIAEDCHQNDCKSFCTFCLNYTPGEKCIKCEFEWVGV